MTKYTFYFIVISFVAFFLYQVFQGWIHLFDTNKFLPKENVSQALFSAWKDGSVCDNIDHSNDTDKKYSHRLDSLIHPCLENTFFQELLWNIKDKVSKTNILSSNEIDVFFNKTNIETKTYVHQYSTDIRDNGLFLTIPSGKFDSIWYGRQSSWDIPIFEKYAVKAEQNYLYSVFNQQDIQSEIKENLYKAIGQYIYYRDYSELLEWFTKLTTSCYGHSPSSWSGSDIVKWYKSTTIAFEKAFNDVAQEKPFQKTEQPWDGTDIVNWSKSAAIAFEKAFTDIAQEKPFQKTEQYSEAQYQFVFNRYFQNPTRIENKMDIPLVFANKKKYESSSYLGCREIIKSSSDVNFKIIWSSSWTGSFDYKNQMLDAYDRVLFVLRERYFISDEDVQILTKRFDFLLIL